MDEGTYSFPLFLFGNSIYSFLELSITNHQVPLSPMKERMFSAVEMRRVDESDEAGFLGTLTDLERFKVIHKQEKGLRYSEYLQNSNVRNKFKVISTFKTDEAEDWEFVAIMEGIDYPIYVVTFNIDLPTKVKTLDTPDYPDQTSASREFK
mmetsp:Transcript_19648/g.18720  ORF Transcript_19648/g.18720 Transcript_19648/m.18720 type:complete len:151 (+) Transcript_19648:541-993(+)